MIRIYLSRLLGEKKTSRAELSRMTGINKHQLSDLYNERTTAVKFTTLEKICKALDCKLNDLIDYIPSPPKEATDGQ